MQWFRHRRERGRPRHPDVLTPAEWRVLEEVRAGRTNTEIAARLGISVNTVRYHVSNMLAKLELRDRSALALWHGEPAEASRAALGRFALGAPFGWAGKAAAGAGVVVLSVGAVVGIIAFQSESGWVIDRGTAERMSPTDQIVCASGPFDPAALTAAPIVRGSGDPAVEAFLDLLESDEGTALGPYGDQPWRLLHRGVDEAEFGTSVPPDDGNRLDTASMVMELHDGVWRWRSGGCYLHSYFEGPGRPASWWVDPDIALNRTSRFIDILVMEQECASGGTAEGRIVGNVLHEDEQVLVAMHVVPLEFPVTCQGHPPTRYRLDLGEPLGDRELLNAGRYPPVRPKPPE